MAKDGLPFQPGQYAYTFEKFREEEKVNNIQEYGFCEDKQSFFDNYETVQYGGEKDYVTIKVFFCQGSEY